MTSRAFIGGAAGFAGDRTDAAGPLVETLSRLDGSRFLMFETLAERTLALSQLEYRRDPTRGYNPALERFVGPVLAACMQRKIRIVGNFGAANPRGAAERLLALAQEQHLAPPRIAIIEGDDVSSTLTRPQLAERETGGHLLAGSDAVVAANVYLGAAPIADALDQGADIVVTGRVADPALALGPLLHVFRWHPQEWDRLSAGVLAGHLLECGSQVTGGYFADPPHKCVPHMAELGYPIAEIQSDGALVLFKPEPTGGRIDRQTVIEQMLYEIHDPSAYLTPDVVLDLTGVSVSEQGANRVRVTGARGKPRPDTLKATVCIDTGILGEAEISYGGRNAAARARLAAETIVERMRRRAPGLVFRVDAIGVKSILNSGDNVLETPWPPDAQDIRLRFAAQSAKFAEVELLLDEVEALYCAGPAGGAGVRRRVTPRLASASCLIERSYVTPRVSMIGGGT